MFNRPDRSSTDRSEVSEAFTAVVAAHPAGADEAASRRAALVCAALDAMADGLTPGDRDLVADAEQLWAAAAADSSAEVFASAVAPSERAGMVTAAFLDLDAAFGSPVELPSWRAELRENFCDPNVTVAVPTLLASPVAVTEMVLISTLISDGNFSRVDGTDPVVWARREVAPRVLARLLGDANDRVLEMTGVDDAALIPAAVGFLGASDVPLV